MYSEDVIICESASGARAMLENNCRLGWCDACLVELIAGEPYCGIKDHIRVDSEYIYKCRSKPLPDFNISADNLSLVNIPKARMGIAKISIVKRIRLNFD